MKLPILMPTEDKEAMELIQLVQGLPMVRDLIFHVPNEGRRSLMLGNKLKRMGVRKGVSDYFLPLPVPGYHGLWIELKRVKGSKTTDEQLSWLKKMHDLGYMSCICYGAEHAFDTIKKYIERMQDCNAIYAHINNQG